MLRIGPPPAPTLFPYTTLFRSSGHIGSQADSTQAFSPDYERWVNRVTGWVRRRGTVVWGWKPEQRRLDLEDRKSTRLNSSHMSISYAVFCLKKKRTRADRESLC